jgi:tRNA nucleotidyltransferase (CCA-adding enzyme)
MLKKIPKEVIEVLQKLEESGFEAFIVGGCVRDLLADRIPKDWDVATNAKPEEVQKIFPDSFYENEFGTVGVKVEPFIKNGNPDRKHDVIEVTTYRIESKYSDKRRPDKVEFAKTLEEDLSRRDFTINAIALKIIQSSVFPLLSATADRNSSKPSFSSYEIVDPYDGQEDIQKKIIRAVGDAHERFDEDALRMMRAVRFHAELGYEIEKNTLAAIKKYSVHLKHIALERIKDELAKIIISDNPSEGIDMLHETKLLEYIIPELEKGVGVKQNRHHIYTIYKHSILSLKFCPSLKLEVRLAALLHDIAKPQTKRGEGEFATFYNHDHVGARVAEKILSRIHFSNEVIQKVKLLVDNHMFYYNPEEVGESSVRRLIQKVGLENMKDLIEVRIADRLGSGTPKAKPYKLRHLEYMIDKLSHDAVSVKMLKINGNDLMKDLNLKPGPKIGAILDVLLAEVIEDASQNNREHLLERAKELDKEDLEKLRQMAKVKIEEKKEEEDKEIKEKHWVK